MSNLDAFDETQIPRIFLLALILGAFSFGFNRCSPSTSEATVEEAYLKSKLDDRHDYVKFAYVETKQGEMVMVIPVTALGANGTKRFKGSKAPFTYSYVFNNRVHIRREKWVVKIENQPRKTSNGFFLLRYLFGGRCNTQLPYYVVPEAYRYKPTPEELEAARKREEQQSELLSRSPITAEQQRRDRESKEKMERWLRGEDISTEEELKEQQERIKNELEKLEKWLPTDELEEGEKSTPP